ncbi:unnamed protein product [Bursaphelenchus xylophilus]|uniref:(pine wood nematode) hypothetical protein n=1 Tax=Bursaphelenchus xylophilus TaxID=6326 RepID=A0A7I8XBV2_BURXY|nr:unnamed protein product [Bursaphelenchus xylophilus]CAG9082929.1 unnamed protein product [Bursaphelenchus xylophilus]
MGRKVSPLLSSKRCPSPTVSGAEFEAGSWMSGTLLVLAFSPNRDAIGRVLLLRRPSRSRRPRLSHTFRGGGDKRRAFVAGDLTLVLHAAILLQKLGRTYERTR